MPISSNKRGIYTAPPYRGQHALQVLRQLHNLTGALFAHAKSANGFPMTDNERALASIWVDFEREANAYVDGSMGVKVEYPISCGVVGGASLDSQNFHFHPSPGLDIKNLQTYSHAVFSRHSGHVARALGGTMSRVIEGIKREED